uniref:Benzyl alcohol O-benzoyltransferase n=1 Tax=Anthurium amnicola TaxID=1678845 RepID=A0A1D1Y9W0_9ARAE
MATSPLAFSVRRLEPVLVAPAEPTPHEFKSLSDIDVQDGTRYQVCGIWFYHGKPPGTAGGELDRARTIRDALSRALVYYYPFAGRIRRAVDGGKPVVECTGEGVLFVEADADVRLEQFGDAILPPIPCAEELLGNVEGSEGVFDCPLLLIQVTRLLCGGIAMAVRLNHVISDAPGLFQFLRATAQLARGALRPTPLPVWKRELLDARDPPQVTCVHHEFDEEEQTEPADSVLSSFFFLRKDVTALRKQLPDDLQRSTTFDVLTACLWRCRTAALGLRPDQRVRGMCIVTGHGRYPALVPEGYYGNAFAHPAALTTAGELCRNPLAYAVRLVRRAKSEMTEEYLRSLADFMAAKRWPSFTASPGSAIFSDLRQLGLRDVDFGWGDAAFTTPLNVLDVGTFYVPCTNGKGEEGIAVVVRLPAPAMDRMAREIESMLKDPPEVTEL